MTPLLVNDKKICFIICANDEQALSEAEYYIGRLYVPDGYSIDLLVVKDAASMTGGYNEAMSASDAKYKVYIHQDVLIVNRNIISELLNIFSDDSIGVIGMIGDPSLSENGIMIMNSNRIGAMYTHTFYQTVKCNAGIFKEKIARVDAVDGFFMATQYDIPWRDDLFDGWDYYDVSQCYEFRKAGYYCVVPYQDRPWCLHDDGFSNLREYYRYRKIFVENYLTEKIEH